MFTLEKHLAARNAVYLRFFNACGAWFECRFRTAGRKGALRRQSPLHPKGEPTPVPLRGSLRCSQATAAAELGLRPQTVLAEFPCLAALLGTCQGKPFLTTSVADLIGATQQKCRSLGLSERQYLAASLLLALLAQPALAAQTCLSHSIDQVGRCLPRHSGARQHVAQQLHGNPPPAPAPAPFPLNLLASQISQQAATGEAYPIAGGDGKDWVLLISAAVLSPESDVIADSNPPGKQMAIIRYLPAKAAKATQSAQPEPRPTLQLRALGETAELLRSEYADEERAKADLSLPECIDPEPSGANPGIYPDLGADYRWLTLSPQHRVLVATIHRNEGYAGGGGSFDAELLLDLRDGTLVPIACYAVSHYQMFGGEWNPDGTRQHPESYAKWKRIIQPGGEWPALQLKATTPGTPSATLTWNPQRGQYVGKIGARSGKKK